MPHADTPPLTRGVVLRGIGFAAAIGLGAVAVWLIATSQTQKALQLGILAGLWGVLLGAYSMFGARRASGGDAFDEPGREVAIRESRAVERGDDAQARRDWEARLERLIQREIGTAVSRETAALRNEITHLRQELLDKVGGQLRLERIETTRLIGSDLEALQHEVRELKVASGNLGVKELLGQAGEQRLAMRHVVEPARIRPVSRPTAEVEADIRPAQRSADEDSAARVNQPIGKRPAQSAPARTAQAANAPREASSDARPVAPITAAPITAAPNTVPPVTAAPQAPSAEPATPVARPARTDQVRHPLAPPPAAPVAPPVPPVQPWRGAPAAAASAAEPARSANGTRPAQAPTGAAPARPVTPPPAAPVPAPVAQAAPPVEKPVDKPAPRDDDDPFASLPRIRPFTDFELEPIETPAPPRATGPSANGSPNSAAANGAPRMSPPADAAPNAAGRYTGRRRRSDDDADASGKHSGNAPATSAAPAAPATPAAADTAGHAASESAGGRRRRTDGQDDGSDLLARLLARESVDR